MEVLEESDQSALFTARGRFTVFVLTPTNDKLIALIAPSSGSLPSRLAHCASGSSKIINQAGLFADLAIKSRVRGKAAHQCQQGKTRNSEKVAAMSIASAP